MRKLCIFSLLRGTDYAYYAHMSKEPDIKKQAVNLSLHPEIVGWLDQIVWKRHYTSRSIVVEELIRDRHDQLFGAAADQKASSATPSAAKQILKIARRHYPKTGPPAQPAGPPGPGKAPL